MSSAYDFQDLPAERRSRTTFSEETGKSLGVEASISVRMCPVVSSK
jgi:hypothetical protein